MFELRLIKFLLKVKAKNKKLGYLKVLNNEKIKGICSLFI